MSRTQYVFATGQQQKKKDRDDLEELLTHNRRSVALLKKFKYASLMQIKENLEVATKIVYDEEIVKGQRRQDTITTIEEILLEQGITMRELISHVHHREEDEKVVRTIKKKVPQMLRYQCEVFGRTYLWSGRARRPDVFRYYLLKNGGDLEDLKMETPVHPDDWKPHWRGKKMAVHPRHLERFMNEYESLKKQDSQS